MNDQQKYKVISLLELGNAPKDIADDLDVPYGAVLKLRREFEEARLNGTIDEVLTKSVILAGETSPIEAIANEATEVTKSINGLEQLSLDLQMSATKINGRLLGLITSCNELNDLDIATEILCKLQNAFLNKSMTQVNIQNNLGESSTPKYNQYLGDAPGE